MLFTCLILFRKYSLITRLFFFLTGQPNEPYDNLDEEEKEKVRALLFIMDIFSISLEGYDELIFFPGQSKYQHCSLIRLFPVLYSFS